MDYGSSTKRFGNYTLNNEDINDAKQAEEFVTDLFHNESDPSLKPFINFTRGTILSKKFHVDSIEIIY